MLKRCKGKRKDGASCSSWALNGSEYCWFHDPDPEIVKKRMEARVNGGRSSRVYNRGVNEEVPSVEYKLRDLQELSRFLEGVINWTLQRRVDTKLANTLGYLAVSLKSCLESSELEERLRKLEEAVYVRQRV